MVPKLMIMTVGKTTQVFLDGKRIGDGVKDLIYSARNSEGELNPTLKLLEIDINKFSLDKDEDLNEFMEDIKFTRKLLSGEEISNSAPEKD